MSKLSAVQIRNAKPQDKPYKLADGSGLYFHVAKSGKRTWRYRFKIAGKESTFTLGEYPQMSLAEARFARVQVREQVKAGVNPSSERRAIKRAIIENEHVIKEIGKNSFKSVAQDWLSQSGSRRIIRLLLLYYFKVCF